MLPRPDEPQNPFNSTRIYPPGLDRKPYATWLLLGANAAMFLVSELQGGSTNVEALLRLGALQNQLIASGEYWRLFTATFLHSGLIHLGFNVLGLFIFGQQIERLYGHARFLAIYILAGLAGSVASYLFSIASSPNSIGVGASGAVFGILGALVAFFLSNRDRFGEIGRNTLFGLLIISAINLFFGFVTPGIDNFAHIGGFTGGFLLGIVYSPNYRVAHNFLGLPERLQDTNSLYRRMWTLPVAFAILTIGVLIGNFIVGDTPITYIRQAEEYHQQGEFALALDSVDKAIEIQPGYAPAYLRRALIMADLGNVQLARDDIGRAMRLGLSESDRSRAIRLLLELQSGR